MSEISLQAYENEIDQLIEQARYVEALAHIRHLLSQSPHYIGAYYFLGKTLLEADLPELAADMFRRALSADPEHLLSRIGLGLAHERHNDLDGALWNLERALELDPGNTDIAEELRRMIGRRDGIELDYVPQSRAGLARLYLRGRLYGRAAEEFDALLVEQSARPDLMTALAEAYWRNGQLVQAAEVCQEILDKMPYNCKANLLLGSLWVQGGQEEGWTYLRRAQEVDPRNDRATELFGSESPLEPAELTVDRLAFDPEAVGVDQQSAWFRRLRSSSISTGISEAPPEMTAAEMRLVDITANLEAQIEIPEWLRELGTGEAAEEGPGGLGWMADVGYAEGAQEAEAPGVEEAGQVLGGDDDHGAGPVSELEEALAGDAEAAGTAPEWLKELTTETADLGPEMGEGAPDWLLELAGERPEPEAGPSFPIETEASDVVGLDAEVETEGAVEVADWLSEFTLDEEGASLAGVTRETALVEEMEIPEGEEGVPDWLDALKPQSVTEVEETAEEVAAEAEEVPDWLAELEPADVEGETSEAALVAEEVPDWLAELEPPELGAQTPEALLEAEQVPDWLAELEPAEAPEGASAEAEDMDWLAALEPVETEVSEAEVVAADVPDWLSELKPVADETPEIALAAEEIPDWLAEIQAAEAEAPEAGEGEETPDWLRDLGVEVPEPSVGRADVTTIAPSLEEEEGVRSGAEALAWVESLAGGWEEEVPVAVEEPVPTTEMPEVLDEAIAAAEETAEAEEESPVVAEAPEGESDLLSGEDALSWLESLAAGKEDELRLQVEQESERRVAEIMGRKVGEVAVEDVTLIEAPQPETTTVEVAEVEEATAEPLEVPTEEALLSGEDALAWLESLTVGKEDELRQQVEQESAERVAEILGRKLPAEIEEAAEILEDMPEAIPETWEEGVAPEPESVGAETLIEVGQGGPAVPVEEAIGAEEVLAEVAGFAGEDALAWLEGLTPEEEADLRAQVAAEDVQVSAAEETATETVFGWSAFSGEPEEVASPEEEPQAETLVVEERATVFEPELETVSEVETAVAEELTAGEILEALAAPEERVEAPAPEIEAPEFEEPAAVVEAPTAVEALEELVASEESVEDVALETEFPEPEVAAPHAEEPSAAQVLEALAAPEELVEMIAPEVEEPEAGEPAVVATAVTAVTFGELEPVAEVPEVSAVEETPVAAVVETPAPRAEAEPSAATGTDLDEMRAYLKQKRSDHAARLTLARALWEVGEISEAMDHYGRLIKSGAKSDDVTQDLERYAEERPDGPGVLRTLGDAYMKYGALDKALEIYNRAMHQL